MKFNFTVRGDRITEDKDYRFIEGNKGYYEAVFSFSDAAWDDCAKLCIVECGEMVYEIPIAGGSCLLPELTRPSARIGVLGVATLDGGDLTTVISTNMRTIGVQDGAASAEVNAQLNTAAEVWQIYLTDMEKSRKAAEEAATKAEDAQSEAENALHDAQLSEENAKSSAEAAALSAETAVNYAGTAEEAQRNAQKAAESSAKSAKSIKELTVSAVSAGAGEEAKVTKSEAEGGIHLEFSIPKGERGLQGEKGDRGLQGEKGEPGKDGADGKDGHTPVKGEDYFTDAEKEEMLSAPRTALNFTNGMRFEVRDGELHAVSDFEGDIVERVLVDSGGDINAWYAEESGYANNADSASFANYAYADEYDRPLKGVGIDEFGDEEDAEIYFDDGYVTYLGIVSNSLRVYFPDNFYAGFMCALYFTTPSVMPDNYSQFPKDIHFKGDSVDDTFVPEPNTRYTIAFDFDGGMLNGYVSGVPAPPVSEVTENE